MVSYLLYLLMHENQPVNTIHIYKTKLKGTVSVITREVTLHEKISDLQGYLILSPDIV